MIDAFGREYPARIRTAESRAPSRDAGLGPFEGVIEVAAARILGGEFDPLDAPRSRVPDRVRDQSNVCLTVERDRRIEPRRLVVAFALQERASEFVFQMEIGGRRQDQDRNVFRSAASTLDDVEDAVDIGRQGATHRQDVEIVSDRAGAPRFQDQLQRPGGRQERRSETPHP